MDSRARSSTRKGTRVRDGLFPIMIVIIYAGVLYSALLITAISTYRLQSNASLVVLNVVSKADHYLINIDFVRRLFQQYPAFSMSSSFVLLSLNQSIGLSY